MSYYSPDIKWVFGSKGTGGIIVGPYPTVGSRHIEYVLESGVDIFINLCDDDEVVSHGDYSRYVMWNCMTKNQCKVLEINTRNRYQLYEALRYTKNAIDNRRIVYVHGVKFGFRSALFCVLYLTNMEGFDKDRAVEQIYSCIPCSDRLIKNLKSKL